MMPKQNLMLHSEPMAVHSMMSWSELRVRPEAERLDGWSLLALAILVMIAAAMVVL